MECQTAEIKRIVTWKEHQDVINLIQRVIELTDLEEKQRHFNLMVTTLSRHEVAEEAVRKLFADSSYKKVHVNCLNYSFHVGSLISFLMMR